MRIAALTVRSYNGNQFVETYREGEGSRGFKPGDDVEAWAKGIIAFWNDTLQPGEHPRELVSVAVTEVNDSAKREHVWHKTNLVTVEHRGQYFDIMTCDACGVTGRRYGVSFIKRDRKFSAKKYEFCTPVCKHEWQDQPGELPTDVCSNCGTVRS